MANLKTEDKEQTPRTPRELSISQYEQLHSMRREYNRFIFQAPTIVVAVVGVVVALLARDGSLRSGRLLQEAGEAAPVLLVVGPFVLIMGYWALRSRLLLRDSETQLRRFEANFGHTDIRMYPEQLAPELPLWKRFPSTAIIVWYLLGLGSVLTSLGVAGLFAPGD